MISKEKPNILFLEDEKTFKKVVRRLFQQYNFLEASTVKEAEELLERYSDDISLVISDNMLEIKADEGINFLKHCEENFPHIKRILVTGFTSKRIEKIVLLL